VGSIRQKVMAAIATAALCALASPALGYAFDEVGILFPIGGPSDCVRCHPGTTSDWKGPHGGYSPATGRCQLCHEVHDAPFADAKLLPGATVAASCGICHDGTGGNGVYNVILARTGTAPGSAHRIDVTSTIPGGNASTGGTSTAPFRGEDGMLSCDDCHSPHDANTVAKFYSGRVRIASGVNVSWSTHLLKRRPGGATTEVGVYGSDWCAACHQGRSTGGAVHNHPVESVAQNPSAFVFESVPVVIVTAEPTRTTWFGSVSLNNGSHLMPYPRTAEQAGHLPLCQQCHCNAMDPGELIGDGSTAKATEMNGGAQWLLGDTRFLPGNPRFQVFPHEAENDMLLVETDDDLCLNCHPAAALP